MNEYLYIDGCSFTWGTGLDNPPEENWPYFLGNKLELPVSNYSIPGQGNDEMFRKVYELFYLTNKTHGDRKFPHHHTFYLPNNLPSIIVIQLSDLVRIRIFDDIDKNWKSASPSNWQFPKKTQNYYWKYYYSIHQNVYYLFTQMLLLKDKCDSLGIEFYVFDGICDINSSCLNNIRDTVNQSKKKLLDLYQVIKDKNFLLYDGDFSWLQIMASPRDPSSHKLFWKDRSGQPWDSSKTELNHIVTHGDYRKDREWFTECDHPTKESHEFIANEIYNFIKESK